MKKAFFRKLTFIIGVLLFLFPLLLKIYHRISLGQMWFIMLLGTLSFLISAILIEVDEEVKDETSK